VLLILQQLEMVIAAKVPPDPQAVNFLAWVSSWTVPQLLFL